MADKNNIKLDFSKYVGTYSLKEASKILASMKQDVFEAEKEHDLKYAESIHGPGYKYELKKGTKVDLTKLDPKQRVCASAIRGYHILMTEK